jgi:DNA repair photolyase
LYSHGYIGGDGAFFDQIYAKTNIADVLRHELPRFSRELVNLGGVTDSYQPAEKDLRLMPGVLELLARFGVPAVISTKSSLILRDMELLKNVAEAGGLMTALTVTTMDNAVASLIEPGSSRPAERMAAIAELKRQGIITGVHLMPIIPYLTSGEDSLEAVFRKAKDAGADYVLTSALNLKGPTRKGFYDSIMRSFPAEYGRISSLYHNSKAYAEYKQQLHETVNRLRTKYKMPAYISPPQNPAPTQLSFL